MKKLASAILLASALSSSAHATGRTPVVIGATGNMQTLLPGDSVTLCDPTGAICLTVGVQDGLNGIYNVPTGSGHYFEINGSPILSLGASGATVGVQGTAQGSVAFANTAAGAFATMLQSSNSATAAWTLTLPPAPPTVNGSILVATTAGVGSWAPYPQPPIYTIAMLPTCNAGAKAALAWVSDTVASALPSFHGTVTGGGSTTVSSLVSCNGANWQYD
jgi:hypothetical protein